MSTTDAARLADAVAILVAIAIGSTLATIGIGSRRRASARSSGTRSSSGVGRIVTLGRSVAVRVMTTRTRRRLVGPDVIAIWIDEVARTARRGASARVALDVPPSDEQLRMLTDELRLRLARGSSPSDAVAGWRRSLPNDAGSAITIATTVLACALDVGGSIAGPLERLATVMRERAGLLRERRAQSAQARMSAWVLTILPFAVLGTLVALDADVRSVVVSPLGSLLVGVGLGLDALGAWWMRRIVSVQA